MYSIILCGGSGTRLWPLSRKNYPKQFLNLYGDKSLLQDTFLRMREIMSPNRIYFITNKDNFFNVLNQIKEVENKFNNSQILIEPASLSTAPATTYAIKYLTEKAGASLDSPIVVLPSDHHIGRKDIFLNLISRALRQVGDNIGTIGIKPTSPHTGYGYIRRGKFWGDYYKAEEFKEKPNQEVALDYLSSGQYFWNSGIYIFKIGVFARELKKYSPEIFSLLTQSMPVFLENFNNLPSSSIELAVSEESDKIIVFEGDFDWSDIGSFDSLAEISSKNTKQKYINIDSKNVFAHSVNNRLITTIGVEDLIIIENNDSILVKKKGKSEDVKKLVKKLEDNNAKELIHNLIVHRSWGKYEVLIEASNLKVKKITVYPGAKLSLQSHLHRAEHWVVVKGLAKIFNKDRNIYLHENQSTFIPSHTKHRLENPGKINLELIEVQTGNYLEEDDILRHEDTYNRDKGDRV